MGKKYLNKVNQLVRRMVTQLLLEQSNDPTIRSGDHHRCERQPRHDTRRSLLQHLRCGGRDAGVQAALDGAAGWLRGQMAPTLRLRNIPQLVFRYDPSLVHGARIDEILNNTTVRTAGR